MKIKADIVKGSLMLLGIIVVVAFLLKLVVGLLPYIVVVAIGIGIWYFFFKNKNIPPTSNTP